MERTAANSKQDTNFYYLMMAFTNTFGKLCGLTLR